MSSHFQVLELFPIPVFAGVLTQIDNRHLANAIYQVRDTEISEGYQEKLGLSNQGGYRTFDLLKESDFLPLKQAIVDLVNEKILGDNWYKHERITLENISALWAIINKNGHNNSVHNHPDSWISGAYYVKVPKDVNNAGSITFRDPILARTYSRDFYRSVPAEKIALPPA